MKLHKEFMKIKFLTKIVNLFKSVNNLSKKQLLLLIVTILVIMTGLFIRFGSLDYDLWFDESGQFWIAQGQSHSNLDFKQGGIKEIFINNREHNLDPPLFGLILHFWSLFNTSIIWLRLLPSIFGLLTIMYIYKTLKLLRLPTNIIMLVTLFSFVSFPFVNYSQELRAYSLGMLSSTSIFYYLLAYLKNRGNVSSLAKLIIFVIVGISTLYSLWLLVPIVFVIILFKDIKLKKYNNTIIYTLIVLFISSLIFNFQTRHQLGGLSIDYLNPFKLGNYSTKASILQKITYLNFGYVAYVLGSTKLTHDLFIAFYSQPFPFILKLLGGTLLFILIINVFKMTNHKYRFLRISLVIYLLLIIEINFLSFLKIFPIGPNRWNLFHAPILLIISAVTVFLFIKRYQWSRFPILVIYLSLIVINILNQFVIPKETSNLRQALKPISLNNTAVYLFSYGVVPTFKYYYMRQNQKSLYYNPTSTDTPKSLQNLKEFLEFSPFLQNSFKKLTIIASEVDPQLSGNLSSVISQYSILNNYDFKNYKYKDVSIFVLEVN